MLDYSKSFIEEQFPVAKLSKESYRERKAGRSQTLTGLGKWWGRKPLILVRAALFGALLPVSDDKKKDKEVFLRILTMDEDGLRKRAEYQNSKKRDYVAPWGVTYETILNEACRPEEIDGPSEESWKIINEHLKTDAHNLQELAQALGKKRFGHISQVGDCFAGGGSNVFEPARMGCDVYGSDLNPLAGLLTWADLNILGSSEEELAELKNFQEEVFDAVCAEIDALGIECNEEGHVAKYYLYCNETTCPECGYKVPLLPSLIVSKKEKLVVQFEEEADKTMAMHLVKAVDMKAVDKNATVQKNKLICPHCHQATSIVALRGGEDGKNLRKWEKTDFVPRENDLFQERLYAIKYVDVNKKGKTTDGLRKKPGPVTDATFGTSYYREPNAQDLAREQKVQSYLAEHFDEWQEKGYIPSAEIYEGAETSRLMRERGWKYWHQLFNPRQLMFNGLLMQCINNIYKNKKELITGILSINLMSDFNSKLSRWIVANGQSANTFYNQAFNTLFNYGVKTTYTLWSNFDIDVKPENVQNTNVTIVSANYLKDNCDIWITDPPYADAVNYHELSEYFLAWDKPLIEKAFPDWYTDSKRALAIKGTGESFNKAMVAAYKNLAEHMPDNGMQIVMFTHQDTKVWAELSMILWSAGLQVTSAWCIATETESGGLKQGNYVKGTVLMVLRKRISDEIAFEDDLYEEIRDAVQEQIDSMHELDNVANPDFNDGDYLLAAYVAALKVLTSYADIEGLDVQYELEKARENNTESPVTKIINTARKEAYDYLVPDGISPAVWAKLAAEERFYLKGLGMELNGVHTLGSFQELGRGFGVRDYDDLLGSTKSNAARLKIPTEFKANKAFEDGLGKYLVGQLLLAIGFSAKKDNVQEGCSYLKSHYADNNEYWSLRSRMVDILEFMSKVKGNANVAYWQDIAEYIVMLKEAVRNDSL
ncbi:anti-phage-associated DUF1156 domain-containing protein [Phascolarctobacterium succinatutens]|uniref:anti-phage-associated DUF1156 domain-containing protein n=1 Tax=Phascolarctobacterium succinatutens TaxID=626940 RepID=UPI003079B581